MIKWMIECKDLNRTDLNLLKVYIFYNFNEIEMKNSIEKIIVVYHGKYLIAKFAFKLDKRVSIDTINLKYSLKNFQNFIFVH